MSSGTRDGAGTQRPRNPRTRSPQTRSPQVGERSPARARGADERAADLYRTGDVIEILGISRRQLQYWAQTDLVRPSARTPGGHHRYRFEDLVALKATKRLIDAGVSVQRIRESIRGLRRMLPQVERPLSDLVLVATGDLVLVFHDGTAFEAVSGQEWVFEVARFQREIEAWRQVRRTAPERKARSVRRPQRWTHTA